MQITREQGGSSQNTFPEIRPPSDLFTKTDGDEAEQNCHRKTSGGAGHRKSPGTPTAMIPQPSQRSLLKSPHSSHSGSSGSDVSHSVRVVVRTRPMNDTETQRGDQQLVQMSSDQSGKELNVVSTTSAGRQLVRPYAFDLCAAADVSQAQMFQDAGILPLLDSALDGYAATVFAYGQTGAGKSYTMSGVEERLEQSEIADHAATDGIIPRSMQYLYSKMATTSSTNESSKSTTRYTIRTSYCEIYNEQVYDLLNATSDVLAVRWNDRNGFFVQDLLVVQCDTLEDAMAVIEEGHRNRRVDSHALNKDSSRSHSIFTVHLDCEVTTVGHSMTKYGKLSFVDLAGSERLKDSKSTNEKETSSINKSLFTLGKVISALDSHNGASNNHHHHHPSNNFVPYRDSKLTKLLMDSLGGDSLTLMIACVSPSSFYLDETLSTLNYATRANNIKNKPTVQMDPKEQLISNLHKEVHRLTNENESLRLQLKNDGNVVPSAIVRPLPEVKKKYSLDGEARDSETLSPTRPCKPGSGGKRPQILSVTSPRAAAVLNNAQTTPRVLTGPPRNIAENADGVESFEGRKIDHHNINGQPVNFQEYRNVMQENEHLRSKLEHLEQVFVNSSSGGSLPSSTPESNSGQAVKQLGERLSLMQEERTALLKKVDALQSMVETQRLYTSSEIPRSDDALENGAAESSSIQQLQSQNDQLQQKLEKFKKREKDLMKALSRRNRTSPGN